MKYIDNKNGFSLVEVMVAIAIMSIISYMISAMLVNSAKSEATTKARIEAQELAKEVNEIMKETGCGLPDVTKPTGIKVTDTNWVATKTYDLPLGLSSLYLNLKDGDRYGNIKINSIKLTGYRNKKDKIIQYFALPAPFSSTTMVKAAVAVEIEAPATSLATIYIPVTLDINVATQVINGCSKELEDDKTADMCKSFSGTYNELTQKCDLPCPDGQVENDDNECIQPPGNGYMCKYNDPCNVSPRFKF